MKKVVLFFVIFLSFSCKKKHSSELVDVQFQDFEKKSDTLYEKNYIAIFEETTEKKTSLTKEELKNVNNNLVEAVNKYNKDLKLKIEQWNKEDKRIKWDFEKEKIDLRYFFRQYIVSKDENGNKIVRVLCICQYPSFWRNEILNIHDGGNCYLDAKINLTKNKTEYFGTHGQA